MLRLFELLGSYKQGSERVIVEQKENYFMSIAPSSYINKNDEKVSK